MEEKQRLKENWLEIYLWLTQMSSSKKQFLVKSIKIPVCLLALLGGMLNFFVISVLCTIYPSIELVTFTPPENKEAISVLWGLVKFPSGADITTSITTGHISLVSIATLGAIVGFYFTPAGKN
jgi:hypothetical protein